MKTTRLTAALFAFAVVFALTPLRVARAQDTDRTDPQMTNTPAPTYVIRNARIVTVSGADIEGGSIVISQGRISAVGANVSAPAGAQEARGFFGGVDIPPGHDRRLQHLAGGGAQGRVERGVPGEGAG